MASTRNRGKIIYVCQQCSAQSVRWEGRCSECGAWNSLVEAVEDPTMVSRYGGPTTRPSAVSLPSLKSRAIERIVLAGNEFNRALGGGIVPGSLVLLGGDPGIGKSTLLLQMCAEVADRIGPVLYVSGEESAEQIKLRADRLRLAPDRLFVLSETALDDIVPQIESAAPSAVVIDSIQTMFLRDVPSAAGSVTQVKECALTLLRI